MVIKIFAVYDSKAKVYRYQNFTRTIGEAVRGFELAVNDEKSEIGKFPEDFTLVEVGEFDDITGKVTGPNIPNPIGMADQFKKVAPSNVLEVKNVQ